MPRRILTTAVVLCSALAAQTRGNEKAIQEFEARKTKVLLTAAHRHVELGNWARKRRLAQQASAQYLRAVEVSEGKHTGAAIGASIFGEAYWRNYKKKPNWASVRVYDRRAKNLEERTRRDRFALARLAQQKKLTEQAVELYRALLDDDEGPLRFDDDGRIPLNGGFVPADIAAHFKNATIEVNGEQRVRDSSLAHVSGDGEIFERASPELSVRSQVSEAQAEALHRVLTALLPHLEQAVGGSPVRQLRVFVFRERASFERYLEGAGYGTSAAHGLMDPAGFVGLVCAEGQPPATVQAIAMHELTHLYEFGVSPVVFPSWYAEAFAETYGGAGTFSFDGKTLQVGGELDAARLRGLDPDQLFPLGELLRMQAMDFLRVDADRAAVFYAQSWAFLRYLRTAAGGDVAGDLELWEARCRGAALGARPGDRRRRDAQPAIELFDSLFGARLVELERGFRAWLAPRIGR